MSHFIKNIQTEKGLLTFHFNRIYAVSGVRYHVSVTEGKLSHYFMMQEGNEQWVFSDITVLPEWIIALERQLETAINDHLNMS
jgi:hypothetical protein